MFKINNEKARGEFIQSPKCQPGLQHLGAEANLEKQGGGICFMACRLSVSMQSHLSHLLQLRPRDQTVPEMLIWDRLFGTHAPRVWEGSAWQPHSHCVSPESPSLDDRCQTKHELRCRASPQRQILVAITCVSLYVSMLPTPQSTAVPIRWFSRNAEPMAILAIRSSKDFASRMAEWIKPNNL